MESLAQYLGEYMNRLGLAPEQWGRYAQALRNPGAMGGADYGAVPSNAAAQAQMPEQTPPQRPQGIGWGMYTEVLKPKRKQTRDKLEEEVEFLRRARLHQALAPRGLYEALGGK